MNENNNVARSRPRLSALFVFALALAACTVIPLRASAGGGQAPQWAMSPPPDSPSALYGVGQRATLDQAKKAALTDIAGKLGTAIKADTTINVIMKNGRLDDSFYENIQAKVASTEFSDFEVLKAEQRAGFYWVLVKVDRAAMTRNLRFKIEQASRELDLDLAEFERRPGLEKVRSGSALDGKLDRLLAWAMTLRAIDSGYDVNPVLERRRSGKQKLAQARKELLVKVEHDSDTRLLARKLEKMLADRKVKVSSKGGRKGKTVINISSEVQYFNILDDHQAKMIVDVQAIDENGKVLATSNHTMTGYSRSSPKMALEQANIKLARQFSKQGLLEALGF